MCIRACVRSKMTAGTRMYVGVCLGFAFALFIYKRVVEFQAWSCNCIQRLMTAAGGGACGVAAGHQWIMCTRVTPL